MITLTPAYGRDYKSKKACLVDLKANKDFILNDIGSCWNGKPCSPSNFKGEAVKVRYKNKTMVFIHTQK